MDLITLYIIEGLKEILPQAEFVTGEDCLNDEKLLKNGEEMECLRVSSTCVDVAMERVKEAVEIGRREGEILGEGMYEMYRLGMQFHQGMPFVASGEENLYPLTRFASDRFVRNGDLVVLSFGGYFNGLFAEAKRTMICGKANAQQKKIYRAVYQAMEVALETIRPGVQSQEVLKKIREIFNQNGFDGYMFKHPLAHGIGVGGWEPPFIESESPGFLLESGMVLSLEPILAVPGIPGGGTVAIGNLVAVTDQGNEVLTQCSYDDNLLS